MGFFPLCQKYFDFSKQKTSNYFIFSHIKTIKQHYIQPLEQFHTWFIHSLNKYLFSTHYEFNPVLGTRVTEENKKDKANHSAHMQLVY